MLHPLFPGCEPHDLRPDQHAARGRPHDHRRSGQAYPGGRADPRAGVLPAERVRVQDDEVKDLGRDGSAVPGPSSPPAGVWTPAGSMSPADSAKLPQNTLNRPVKSPFHILKTSVLCQVRKKRGTQVLSVLLLLATHGP